MSRLGNIGGRLYRGEVSFDFVGKQKLWYRISAAILLVSIGALIFRGLSYSVDFKGGARRSRSTWTRSPGDRVLMIDDVLATGGTAAATAALIRRCGAEVVSLGVLIELGFLGGRASLRGVDVRALLAL